MGCGGSRADAIEPRYYESWTRETESTWLTYTDSDSPPSAAAADSGAEAGGLHAGGHEGFSTTATELRAASILFQHRGWGAPEEGLSSKGVPRPAAPGGVPNPEKKMSCGTQCPNPQSFSSGALTQKQNGLRTVEGKVKEG
nr:brain and acute leukemia cytoplasmic protein isoform X5 [Manis javanica]